MADKKTSEFEQQLAELNAALEAEKEAKLRVFADLENLRRREAENKKNWVSFGIAEFVKQMLPQIQTLRLAAEHTEDADAQKAVQQFLEKLAGQGLVQINPQSGEALDPEKHDVMMVAEGEAGTVVQTLEPGWQFGEVIIAPAKVSAAPSS